jgi:hypothetical protein
VIIKTPIEFASSHLYLINQTTHINPCTACRQMSNCDDIDSARDGKQKSKAAYQARAARQAEAAAALARRHPLCINGDPRQPLTIELPPGTRIEPEFLATFVKKKSVSKRLGAD